MTTEGNYQQIWNRYHELRDIKAEREFTESEKAEYVRYEEVVKRHDEEDVARCRQAMNKLTKKHQKVISSIERLTESVRRQSLGDGK